MENWCSIFEQEVHEQTGMKYSCLIDYYKKPLKSSVHDN